MSEASLDKVAAEITTAAVAEGVARANTYTDERLGANVQPIAENVAELQGQLKALRADLEILKSLVLDPDEPEPTDPEPFLIDVWPKLSTDPDSKTVVEWGRKIVIVANQPFGLKAWFEKSDPPGSTVDLGYFYDGDSSACSFYLDYPGVSTIIVEPQDKTQPPIRYHVKQQLPEADEAPPVVTIPDQPRETIYVQPGKVGVQITGKPSNRNPIIENKRIVGMGTPGKDGEQVGIRVVADIDTLTVRNCELDELTMGIIAQGMDGGTIDKTIVQDTAITDIRDTGPGDAFTTRAQGIYAQGAAHVIFQRVLTDMIGWGDADPRDIFSHGPYISTDDGIPVLFEAEDYVSMRASSHAINCGDAKLKRVIAINSPVHFGVKKIIGAPTDLYSVNVNTDPVGQWAKRGWHYYKEYPSIEPYIKVIDGAAIDYEAIRKAAWGKWYAVARGMLK